MKTSVLIVLTVLFHSKRYAACPAIAKLSGFVRSLDEIFGCFTIECSRVSSNCLGKVVEFLNHYEREAMKTIKTPLVDHTFEGIVKQTWYREYVKVMDDILLSDMIDAAKFMDIGE